MLGAKNMINNIAYWTEIGFNGKIHIFKELKLIKTKIKFKKNKHHRPEAFMYVLYLTILTTPLLTSLGKPTEAIRFALDKITLYKEKWVKSLSPESILFLLTTLAWKWAKISGVHLEKKKFVT